MSFQQNGIMAVGHVLVDTIGDATEMFVERFGDMVSPAHVTPEKMRHFYSAMAREPGLLRAPLAWTAGGGVSIVAKAALALGMPAEVWGAVGRDEEGAFLARDLAEAGVKTKFLLSEVPTGSFCGIATPGGGKKIIVNPGAAKTIRNVPIPAEAFHDGWVFYLDGLLIDSPAWLAEQAEKAKAKGMSIAMDVSTSANAKRHAAALLDFANAYCDVVFANEAEFQALGGTGVVGARLKPKWVVKEGENGATIYAQGLRKHAEALKTESVDDTGAGDVFSAGFLLASFEGFEGGACLRMGNAVASAALRFRGSGFDPRALERAYEDERHSLKLDIVL